MLRVRASWWRGAPAGRALAGAISLGAVACGAAPTDGDFHGEEPIGEVRQGITVDQAVSGGCSTATVAGLNQQIIDGMNCLIAGGALKEVPARSNFKKGGTTLAWMQPAAVDALVAALDARPTTTFTANSMFRTVAAQYLLYRWYEAGRCGIQLAAPPGTSNHESGLAIDVQEYSTWRSTLEARGFVWLGSGDVVHYDYKGAGATNLKGKDVLAYQRLWNLNHPEDLLDEDGVYGPQTGARLAKSPVDGFAKPPTCGSGGAGGAGGGTGTGTG
ncbi:MAG: M15 family metallopeptidase, partial [Sorangiineae bacterium]|nr:M15 family metallopeptidase [Sorangiineae bacterium]